MCAVYKSRKLSWDSSRVGRSSTIRAGEGIDARNEDDERKMCDDEGGVPSGLLFVSSTGETEYLLNL